MKIYPIILLIALWSFNNDTTNISNEKGQDELLIYKFSIDNNIDPAMWRKFKMAITKAEEMDADFFLIEMNTYGGYVYSADSIRSAILNLKIPTIVFINKNAASAGALIAIACDSIFMHSGASMGAATVVNNKGEKMPDKYQSYMRATMRSTAESHGKDTTYVNGRKKVEWRRDPKIAEAMVDESIEIKNIIEEGKILTFTAREALENNYCEGIIDDLNSVVDILKRDEKYEIVIYKPTTLDSIIGFMINPYLQSILILIIIGGIYFELQTPGVGFPILASIIAAIFYLSPLYIEGLATNWEIAIFILGIILVGLEVFVIPGFGVAGISGIILIVVGLSLSLFDIIDFEYEGYEGIFKKASKAFFLVILSFGISLLLPILFGRKIVSSKVFGNISLDTEIKTDEGFVGVEKEKFSNLIGKTGLVIGDLRPAGTVEIENEYYDAKSIIGFIAKGKKVKVIRHEASQIYVDEIE